MLCLSPSQLLLTRDAQKCPACASAPGKKNKTEQMGLTDMKGTLASKVG